MKRRGFEMNDFVMAACVSAVLFGLVSCKEPTSTVSDTPPTVVTGLVSNITPGSATISAEVASEGSSAVTLRGVCFAETPNPLTIDTCVNSGSGAGIYEVTITGLSPGATYYARPYAMNEVGTGYGDQVDFTAGTTPPLVVTGIVSEITPSTAKVSGEVTSTGGAIVTSRGLCYATTQNPTTADSCVWEGPGMGSFTSKLIDLTLGTTYYVRAYATNAAGTAYSSEMSFTTLPVYFTPGAGVTDIDGNAYSTVIINGQEWMAENLKTSHYRNGDEIPNGGSLTGAWWNYMNQSEYDEIFGKLYNWYAVDHSAGLCPTGWHVPTNEEWTEMVVFLGNNPGNKMKAPVGTFNFWNTSNSSNESGFTGYPGGLYLRNPSGFHSMGSYGFWWSSSEVIDSNGVSSTARSWHLVSSSNPVFGNHYDKRNGFSVRCVRVL